MDVAALELQIGADVTGAVKGLGFFEDSLESLKSKLASYKAVQETSLDPASIDRYGKKYQAVAAQIVQRTEMIAKANGEVSNSVTGAAQSMNVLAKSSSSATNSLFALSGIVQDAPYGFRAIANNITFFSQQMAYSAKASGGFMAALKSLGGAFLGPAGMIFLVSAATSLLTSLFSKMDKTKKSAAGAADAVQTLATANLKGSQSAQDNAIHLDLLYKAATDASKSMKTRTQAVKDLQKEYPTYLGNLSKEAILTGKAADKYIELRNQILATARAKAAEQSLIQNQQKALEIEEKLRKLGEERQGIQKQIAAATEQASSANQTSAQGYNSSAIAVTALSLKLSQHDKVIKETVNSYNELADANKRLSQNINTVDLTAKPVGAPPKAAKTPATKISGTDQRGAAVVLMQQIDQIRAAYADFTQTASANVGDTVNAQFAKIGYAVRSVDTLLTKAEVRFKQFQERLKEGALEASKVISEGIQDTIANVAEGFATGGFIGAAQALLSTLGDIAIQLGKIAIGVGLGVQGIKMALESLNPVAAIAAGVALIALGAVAKSAVQGLTPMANGAIAYGPTPALVGEYAGASSNPEVIAPLDKLKALIGGDNVKKVQVFGEFVQRGNDMVAVLNRATSRTKTRQG